MGVLLYEWVICECPILSLDSVKQWFKTFDPNNQKKKIISVFLKFYILLYLKAKLQFATISDPPL